MTQARTPAGSSGSEYLVDATQLPTARTFSQSLGVTNRMKDGVELLPIIDETLYSGTIESTSSAFVYRFIAKDKGWIESIGLTNGSVALNATVGVRLNFLNLSNSSASLADFGFGSATNAALATDKTTTVAASTHVTLANSKARNATTSFNKGDVISVTAARDDTTFVGECVVAVSYDAKGRS